MRASRRWRSGSASRKWKRTSASPIPSRTTIEPGRRREQQLGHAVVGPRQLARVDRQQREREELRDDVGDLVGGAGRSSRRMYPYIAPLVTLV